MKYTGGYLKAIRKELMDELLQDYQKPEDIIGENGILKQLTKAIIERALGALGSLIIKERLRITDRETVEQIKENPYLQYFLGFSDFTQEAPFDASMLVHFRKRISDELVCSINEKVIESAISKRIQKAHRLGTPKILIRTMRNHQSETSNGRFRYPHQSFPSVLVADGW